MKTKLTLSLQEDVIEQAKAYAKDQETSISSLVENYLKVITSATRKEGEQLKIEEESVNYKSENTPIVQRLRGILDPDKITGHERYDYLMEKHK